MIRDDFVVFLVLIALELVAYLLCGLGEVSLCFVNWIMHLVADGAGDTGLLL